MEIIFSLLALVAGIGSLVCWIWTIVVAFKEGDGPLLGIFSICGIVGFIIGWIHNAAWAHTKVMIAWSICIIVGIIAQIGLAVMMGGSGY